MALDLCGIWDVSNIFIQNSVGYRQTHWWFLWFKYECSFFLMFKLCGNEFVCLYAVLWFMKLKTKDPWYGNSTCWNWPCGPVGTVSHPSYLSDPNAPSLPEPAAARCGLVGTGVRITVAMVTATANCLDNIGLLMRSKRAGLRLEAGTGGGEWERNQPVDIHRC